MCFQTRLVSAALCHIEFWWPKRLDNILMSRHSKTLGAIDHPDSDHHSPYDAPLCLVWSEFVDISSTLVVDLATYAAHSPDLLWTAVGGHYSMATVVGKPNIWIYRSV
jgi:hypothetical protein